MKMKTQIITSCVGACLGALGLCLLCMPWVLSDNGEKIIDADYKEVDDYEY